MSEQLNILVVIPARGNSKGIPRKNLRSLHGKPLIWYSIRNCLASKWNPKVYLSSDDEEIKTIAKKCGAKIINRSSNLAEDNTTLDPVIYDAYEQAKKIENQDFDLIVTVQPTSPLLKTRSLDEAIEHIIDNSDIDTLISATEETHLTWSQKDDRYIPNYEKRVNRQELTPQFKETGGFLICRNSVISETGRIGSGVGLFALKSPESIDIDTFEDWNLCNYYLSRKKILFVVSAYDEIGMGHVYRTLNIANEILDHEVLFLFDNKSQLGRQLAKNYHYPNFIQSSDNLLDDIKSLHPDIVINDILDTSESYMNGLKEIVDVSINFEDLGPGSFLSNVTINAMYQDHEKDKDHRYFGYEYSVLRDEFLLSKTKSVAEKVQRILISFGGTDPNDYTNKVLACIYDFCAKQNIKIDVVLGLGYRHKLNPSFENINVHHKISNISEIMLNSDLAFSSAGRTTIELASLGVPTIVLCQNQRETTHLFSSEENGFNNVGMGSELNNEELFNVFLQALEYDWRKQSNRKMLSLDLSKGKSRVLELIYRSINTK